MSTPPSATTGQTAGQVVQTLDDPYLKALREYIFNTAMGFAGQPLPIEAIVSQIAPFNPLEQSAIDIAAALPPLNWLP